MCIGYKRECKTDLNTFIDTLLWFVKADAGLIGCPGRVTKEVSVCHKFEAPNYVNVLYFQDDFVNNESNNLAKQHVYKVKLITDSSGLLFLSVNIRIAVNLNFNSSNKKNSRIDRSWRHDILYQFNKTDPYFLYVAFHSMLHFIQYLGCYSTLPCRNCFYRAFLFLKIKSK